MGMGFPFGGSSYSRSSRSYDSAPAEPAAKRAKPKPVPGDPNPARFKVLQAVWCGKLIAVEVIWPDAKNYDGRKIAVYRATLAEIANAKELDPHFGEERGPLVPIARFEPTPEGWQMALFFINKWPK